MNGTLNNGIKPRSDVWMEIWVVDVGRGHTKGLTVGWAESIVVGESMTSGVQGDIISMRAWWSPMLIFIMYHTDTTPLSQTRNPSMPHYLSELHTIITVSENILHFTNTLAETLSEWLLTNYLPSFHSSYLTINDWGTDKYWNRNSNEQGRLKHM